LSAGYTEVALLEFEDILNLAKNVHLEDLAKTIEEEIEQSLK